MTAVQRLYDVCNESFTISGYESLEVLENVRSILDTIRPVDVGLQEEAALVNGWSGSSYGIKGRRARNGSHRYMPPITYLRIHECERFSIGIFCMPTSSIIPLHNHPGMTVLSKLLYGSVHAKAFDWVNSNEASDPSKPRLATLVKDHELRAPCNSTILYPTSGGNIHCFRAETPCALLDVLAPPYSTQDGRHCSYFRKSPRKVPPGLQGNSSSAAGNQLVWLEEFQPPEDFVVQRGLYRGPRVLT